MADEAQAEWGSLEPVVVGTNTYRAASKGMPPLLGPVVSFPSREFSRALKPPDKAVLFDAALHRLRAEAALAEELCLVAALEMRRMKYCTIIVGPGGRGRHGRRRSDCRSPPHQA